MIAGKAIVRPDISRDENIPCSSGWLSPKFRNLLFNSCQPNHLDDEEYNTIIWPEAPINGVQHVWMVNSIDLEFF